MVNPVTCASCGAKVREDRLRCLRCGAPLVPKAPDRVATLSNRTLVGLAVIACVVLGGFAVGVFNRPVPGAAPANAVPPAATAPLPATVVDAAASSTPVSVSANGAAVDRVRDGVAAYTRGDIAGSVGAFQAAVDAAPDDASARNNLGQVLVRAGRAREALPHFDRAVELSAETWAYRFNRGRAYAMLEKWSRAVADYRAAAGLFPDDYVTQFNLARALQASGDVNAAIDAYRKAIELAPGQAEFQLSLANALETAGRSAEAVAVYRRYLELEPEAAQAEKIKQRIAQLTPAAPVRPQRAS